MIFTISVFAITSKEVIYNLLDYITYLKPVKIKLSHDKEIVATPMPETRKAAQNVENAVVCDIYITSHRRI